MSLVAMMVAVLLAVGASAALAAPQWRIDSLSTTTTAPGDTLRYIVQLTNVGDATADATADQITFTAVLPPGLTALEASSFLPGWDCSLLVVGDPGFTCTDSSDTLDPNDLTQMFVDVAVDGAASGEVTTRFDVSGGGAVLASTVDPIRITPDLPDFGVDAFDGQVTADATGTPFTQAGGHPYAASTSIDFNTIPNAAFLKGTPWPVEPVKDVLVDLPPGFVGNPTGIASCTLPELANTDGIKPRPLCPPTSQVGVTLIRTNVNNAGAALGPFPVFNIVPPPGSPARLGFNVAGSIVTLDVKVRSDSDYGVTAVVSNVPEGIAMAGTILTLWGVPADPSHDFERACAGKDPPSSIGGSHCTSGAAVTAFLRNPTSCTPAGEGLPTTIHTDSWVDPGDFKEATFFSHLPNAYPFPPSAWGPQQGTTDCDRVPFRPTIQAKPTSTIAGKPSAFSFDVSLPQTDAPNVVGQADLKRAVVTLPLGMSVNPSSAAGLDACTPGQVRLHSTDDANCPPGSKLGSVTIDTPLLDTPIEGSVYLAGPHDNPFDTLLALYIVAKGSGVIIKLPGKVEADPITGQLTTTFDDNPQLPFSNLHLQFKDGPRAPLVNPNQCGTYATSGELTSWSGKTVTVTSPFDISGDGNGSACPAKQFKPTLDAGVSNPTAGSSSSFVLRLQRDDIDNEFKTISTTMPPGLLAKVAGVPLCGDAAAAAGNCPADSQIGRVEVGAGAGTNPFYITNGKVYLTEGYKGGPFGLAISVPAVAGPYDLGVVNVRAALQIDPLTAQVTVVADPMPRILEGIPLQVRDVRVIVDRDGFMQAPTNCNEMSVGATVGSYSDDSASVSDRFQVGECAGLAFAPKISMGLTNRSQMHKRKKPGLDFRLSQKPGEANIKSVTVKLPRALVLDVNGASGALCEVAQAENGSCPASSIVGHATAVTPLLDQPLSGAVYFVRGDNALPNIMVALRGAISINLRSKSKVDKSGRLISTFGTVPDAPIRQFHLTLGSAGRGVLSVAPDSDLCTGHNSKGKVSIAILGQNGKRESLAFKMRTPCKKARRHRR